MSKFKIYFYDDGFFVVKFNSENDREEIRYTGFYIMNNKFIILRVWLSDFDF